MRAIRDALDQVCDELQMPDDPQIMPVRNVQHLATPVRGRLRGRPLRARPRRAPASRPRPSAAPARRALAAIREREGLDRGWYAGPVGWVDAAGDGEFAVALRSGCCCRRLAVLYAGGGIVADSDPGAEYAETALKLRPMLRGAGRASA